VLREGVVADKLKPSEVIDQKEKNASPSTSGMVEHE